MLRWEERSAVLDEIRNPTEFPEICCSPDKHLYLSGNTSLYPELAAAFAAGSGQGLLFLDTASGPYVEQPLFAYWKDFTRLYLSLFTALPDLDAHNFNTSVVELSLPDDDLINLRLSLPPMRGGEYCDMECFVYLWNSIACAFHLEILQSKKKISDFLAARHSGWSILGKVCFHLAESKKTDAAPFAFLATFVNDLNKDGRSRHLPLGQAMNEFGGARNNAQLLRVLAPVYKAVKESRFLKEIMDSGEIYHPLALTAADTFKFLKDIPIFQRSGIHVRVPDWWKGKKSRHPVVQVDIGDKKPGQVGLGAMLDFRMSVVMDGQVLAENELQDLLSRTENLVFFRGKWVEVDRGKLSDMLTHMKSRAGSARDGLSFAEALRWMSGFDPRNAVLEQTDDRSYMRVVAGQWLERALSDIRSPGADLKVEHVLRKSLKAELRPYQTAGVLWLNMLYRMRLGAVLADDMGLGKTIQVLALLLIRKNSSDAADVAPALLVVPASIIGNWKAEIERFAPSLRFRIAHASADGLEEPKGDGYNIIITTYGSVVRAEWLRTREWGLVILDEAQAIKTPSTRQTKAVKALKSQARIALTGTPVENHLSDLWSIFDFLSPGLLGSDREFGAFIKRGGKTGESPYAALRELLKPYILRRLKTDKTVIRDLPEKTEIKTFCSLSRAQAALYQQAVHSLERDIEQSDGMKRRGIVFSYLMRFKQICNHPAHFLKEKQFNIADSGKFQRLKELCETIAEKQEKVLVFTQFQEMTGPLAGALATFFGRGGLIIDGKTPIGARAKLVKAFQEEQGPPFFVLSLKAGGVGLNLTAASHVIHFDRWWNPAVENQATDRAFRIGQKKNVLVHKFICRGTLEEKIDMLITSKLVMATEILEGADSVVLTELSNSELLKVVSLDIRSAFDTVED
ncbi:MAG: DEAD/DEAH box helicase [Candidatus Omnitrophica bacterium]|nr:DEAD/DEAH box helicase [Candidatus Omnitrophota bacterium]